MSENETLIREVLKAWGYKERLVEFAKNRHGFGNSDGGFGVSYPSDAKQFEEEPIQEGYVEIYGFWGPPNGYERLVRESEYLEVLAKVLRELGLQQDAEEVESLIVQT